MQCDEHNSFVVVGLFRVLFRTDVELQDFTRSIIPIYGLLESVVENYSHKR
jgi:hypothetical protein